MMIYGSKKATITGIGLILAMLCVTILPIVLKNYVEPEELSAIIKALLFSIGILTGAYNVGQGMADFQKEAAKEWPTFEAFEEIPRDLDK